MPAIKPVLLARPHPIIVGEMLPMLEKSGYTPLKLEHIADLPRLAQRAHGAVISLAISSSIAETPEEVYLQLRRHAPNTPVVFAALLEFTRAARTLEKIAQRAGIQATILGVDKSSDSSAKLGKPTTFFYVNKEDLASPEYKALAARLIQRHLG